jgi:Flp pilus assembly protein TadG
MRDRLRRVRKLIEDETGAALVLVTLTVTLLFFFSAVAIDATGFGYNERRQSQSAADVGALAAAQFAVPTNLGNLECTGTTGLARGRCNGAVEAIEVVNATVNDASLLDWNDASKCPGRPAGYTASSITPCVAFNANNQRAWVRIPTIEMPTTLARVVGINTILVSADAIAGTGLGYVGNVLPFLSPGNAAGANYNCLKSGPNPNFGACADNPTTGNFGLMDFYLYGNVDLGYTARCTGDTQGRLVANIARGIDHPLSTHPDGFSPGLLDQTGCTQGFNAQPNMVYTQTGVGSQLEDGILYGGSSYSPAPYPGRIQVSSGGYLVRNAQGGTPAARVDNTPLWSYLLAPTTANQLGGTACDRTQVDTPAEMLACVAWAKAQDKIIFDDDLATSRRFGFTPSMWEPEIQGPSQPYHIRSFLPIYIDTTFYDCNANRCTIMHTPAVVDSGSCPTNPLDAQITCGTPGGGNRSLEGVSAYILSRSIVPLNAQNPTPGDINQLRFSLIE